MEVKQHDTEQPWVNKAKKKSANYVETNENGNTTFPNTGTQQRQF